MKERRKVDDKGEKREWDWSSEMDVWKRVGQLDKGVESQRRGDGGIGERGEEWGSYDGERKGRWGGNRVVYWW